MWYKFSISVVDKKMHEMLGDNAQLEQHSLKLHLRDIRYFHGTSNGKNECTVLYLEDGTDITVNETFTQVDQIHSRYIIQIEADANS